MEMRGGVGDVERGGYWGSVTVSWRKCSCAAREHKAPKSYFTSGVA